VVLLAAGASERLGQCKALVDLGGRSALQRLVEAADAAGAESIHVVCGAHAPEIGLAVEGLRERRRVEALVHPGWARGRGGSLACAALHLPGRDLLVAPVDVPLVPSLVFRQLFLAWELAGDPPRGWLAPFVAPGRRFGHPWILGRELAAGLPGTAPEQPLKALRALADPVWGIEVFDPAILDDLDTPADLERLRNALRRARE